MLIHMKEIYIIGCILLIIWFIYSSKLHIKKINEYFYQPKVAIITANFGSYDTPKSHSNVLNSDLVDWYCWTDNKNLKKKLDSKWKVITKSYHLINMGMIKNRSKYYNSIPNRNKRTHNMMSAKFYKACTHKIPELAKYDYWIWIDGSVYLRDGFVNEMLKLINQGHKIISFAHSVRNNITDEFNLSIQMEKYAGQDLLNQFRLYMDSGFEDNQGLYENTIMVKANDPAINKIFDDWWIHNLKYSYQDQISWPYVLWLNQTKPDHIINLNVFDNDIFSYVNFSEMTAHAY